MKKLHEYETPETSKLLTLILDEDSFLDQRNAPEKWVKFARDLERRLALCRDALTQVRSLARLAWNDWSESQQKRAGVVKDLDAIIKLSDNCIDLTAPKQ